MLDKEKNIDHIKFLQDSKFKLIKDLILCRRFDIWGGGGVSDKNRIVFIQDLEYILVVLNHFSIPNCVWYLFYVLR